MTTLLEHSQAASRKILQRLGQAVVYQSSVNGSVSAYAIIETAVELNPGEFSAVVADDTVVATLVRADIPHPRRGDLIVTADGSSGKVDAIIDGDSVIVRLALFDYAQASYLVDDLGAYVVDQAADEVIGV